ncbi:MAG TPA: hypothetical protein PLO99_08610, partial [Chitinophagaceae bacterium]|nr:hypothetical protein [Chitinophagaceae bacterium]
SVASAARNLKGYFISRSQSPMDKARKENTRKGRKEYKFLCENSISSFLRGESLITELFIHR